MRRLGKGFCAFFYFYHVQGTEITEIKSFNCTSLLWCMCWPEPVCSLYGSQTTLCMNTHTRIFIYFKDKGRACQASRGCWLCVDLAAALEKEGTRWQTAACLSVPSSSYNAAHTAAKYIKTQHLNFTAAILWSENCWSQCLHCTQSSSSLPFSFDQTDVDAFEYK